MKGGTKMPKSTRLFFTGTVRPGTKNPLQAPRRGAWSLETGFKDERAVDWNRYARQANRVRPNN